MENIKIKECKLSDIEELQKISYKTFDETFRKYNKKEDIDLYLKNAFTITKLKGEIENKFSKFYLLYFKDELVAYLKLNILDAQSEQIDENALEIERIYILQKYQKHRIGEILVEFAVEKAKTLKKDKIWLGVWEHNEKALKFYKKIDFKIISSHDFYMGEDRQKDYIMIKEL